MRQTIIKGRNCRSFKSNGIEEQVTWILFKKIIFKSPISPFSKGGFLFLLAYNHNKKHVFFVFSQGKPHIQGFHKKI